MIVVANIMLMTLVFLPFTAFSQNGSEAEILLPPAPRPILPPPLKKGQRELDLDDKKKQRQKRDRLSKKKYPGYDERLDRALLRNAYAKRPSLFYIQVSMVSPSLLVSGPRENYMVEPSSHFEWVFRTDPELPCDDWQSWFGFRLAPFSGSGAYEGIPGRFGFLYLGPVFGYGSVDTVNRDLRPEDMAYSADKSFPVRTGNIFLVGVAAQIRNGTVDSADEFPSEDLDSKKGASFDSPGLSFSWTHSRIYYGALGLHLQGGTLLGSGKTFTWLSVGVAGWY